MMKRGQSVRSALLPLFLLLLPLLSGCATIPYDYPRTLSTALYLPEATSMGKKIQAQAAEHPGASGFYLLASEEEAFLARVRWIDRAEKTLDLQYYIFSADLTGRFILDRIIAAAERGVRVRLLLDDWRQTAEMDRWLAMMENYPSVEVRIFNPFGGLRSNPLSRPLQAIFGPKRLQGRMHNKAFIVDNSVAIVGGRNIADEYFGSEQCGQFQRYRYHGRGTDCPPGKCCFRRLLELRALDTAQGPRATPAYRRCASESSPRPRSPE